MSTKTTRTLLLGALALQLCACGGARKSAPDPVGGTEAGNVVDQTLPATGGAPAATAPGQVRTQMPAGPVINGIPPVSSAMPPVASAMPPAGYAPPPSPIAAQPITAQPEDQVAAATPVATGPTRESVTSGQVCAAAIGMLFGRDPSGMQVVSDAGGLARVKYRRTDQTTWTNECRVTDRTVAWRAIGADGPGRWRNEDTITYTASTAGIAMTVNGETRAFAR